MTATAGISMTGDIPSAAAEGNKEGIMKYIYIILLAVFILGGCAGGVRTGATVNKRVSNNVSIGVGAWR